MCKTFMEELLSDRDSRSEYWDRDIKGKVSRFLA
jgi:hypothetical protein